MDKKRKRTGRRTPPKKGSTYGGRLAVRVFFSVLLILAAVFMKHNAPSLAEKSRTVLFEGVENPLEKEA